MEFNTLDAQRESCEAYIASQRSDGWRAVPTFYDDGGYSGGNMSRPGLQALLTDIKAGKVDIVVVYKIDRLTRSLMDFSKLVEIFDEFGVTFVSVTQSFNTTTSMGRLTLNVLLSFAQFEREVSAERIRDKIAASKKKGLWMGGVPPVGYDVTDRKLVINKDGARRASNLFERYLELGCVAKLKRDLDKQNTVSQERVTQRGQKVGGKPYSRGALYGILQNPIYIGKIRHKEMIYEGQHDGIISQKLWDDVQERLKIQAATPRGHKNIIEHNLLKGLLFDCDGTPYSPDYTKKKNGRIYRYYTSQNLIQHRDHPKGTMARLPAHEIEKAVTNSLHNVISEPCTLKQILNLDAIQHHEIIDHINKSELDIKKLISICVNSITIEQEAFSIHIKRDALCQFLKDTLSIAVPIFNEDNVYVLVNKFTSQRSNKGAVIIKPDRQEPSLLDLPPVELRNLVRGIIWRNQYFGGELIRDIATRENLSESGVRKIIAGSFDTLMAL